MEELLSLLKDGKSRTLEMLAMELGTSVEKVKRDIEFLERSKVIRKIDFSQSAGCGHSCSCCSGCSGCSGGTACLGCMPEGGFKNMGAMWEVS